MEYYEGTNRENKAKSSNFPRRITVNDVGIFDEHKFQMLQQPSNPT